MKPLKYPLILSDFDGTLLRSDETVSDETIRAINEYRAAGGRFALCTGRMFASALQVAKHLGITGLLACFQGSIVADIESEELIVDAYLDNAGAAQICEFFQDQNQHFHVYDTYEYYSNLDDEWLYHYERIVGAKAIVKSDEPLSAFVEKSEIKVRKIIALVHPEQKEKLYNELQQRFGDRYYVTYSAAFMVEISSKAHSKATALEKIAQYYGLTPEQTIAVGDSMNDLPMIERAGLGVAVNNAEKALKEKADLVLERSNDEDGVADLIRNYAM